MEPMADATTVERILLDRARAQKIPINGSLELLPLCNLNCKMCYVRLSRKEMETQGRMRTLEEWLDAAHQMKDAGVLFLLLTGGEPLLYPGFRDLFIALKRMGMVLTINTNGTLLDEEWADFFARYKPRRINVTLYGSSEDAYRELCGVPEGFERALRGIRMLRERGVDVKIAGSATRANEAQLEDIIRLGHSMNVPVMIDTYMMPAVRERNKPYDHQSRLDPEAAARARVRSLALEMQEEAFRNYRRGMIEAVDSFVPGEPVQQPIGCMAANCSFTVNWKGELQPCVILNAPAVNIFEAGFRQAWQTVVAAAAEMKTSEKCSVCALRPLCRTCVGAGITETGRYDGVPAYMCRYAAETLRLFRELEDADAAGEGLDG